MRRIFKKSDTVELEGYKITRSLVKKQRKDINGYDESKHYTFERTGSESEPVPAGAPKPCRDRMQGKVSISFVRPAAAREQTQGTAGAAA